MSAQDHENPRPVMTVNSLSEESVHSTRTTISFGFGAMADQMSHQFFQFAAFTFYYAVVGINLYWLAPSYILFAIWDSINDPLIGVLSDRTQSKFGRRRFWVLISLIPFALTNLFMFFPPRFWPIAITNDAINTAYMIALICLYDLFYSMFSANQTALFPEMFKSEKERGRANRIKNTMTILGVLIGFAFPSFLINPMAPSTDNPSESILKSIASNYLYVGALVGILTLIIGYLFFRFGMKEDSTEITKPEEMPGLIQSLKDTFSNKTFMTFVTANMLNWFVFKLLTAIISLYGIWVLGIQKGDFLLTVMLLVAFLTASAFFPVMEWLGNKIGFRNGFIVSNSIWIASLIPYYFFSEETQTFAVICMFFVGIGLAGAMYYVDIILGRVIDEDEVKTGHRRQGSFYGVNSLINRYSTILVVLVITFVLAGYGWDDYVLGLEGGAEIPKLQLGLRLLMSVANIIGIVLVIILLIRFPLHGDRWKKVQLQLKQKHRSLIQTIPEVDQDSNTNE